MTNEERQRQMDFIIGALAQISAKTDSLADSVFKMDLERKADACASPALKTGSSC